MFCPRYQFHTHSLSLFLFLFLFPFWLKVQDSSSSRTCLLSIMPEGEVIVTQLSSQNLREASQQLEDDSLSNTGCWLGAQFLAGLLGRAVGNVIRKTRLYPEGPLLPRFLDNVTQSFDRNLREAASGSFPGRYPRS